MAPPFFLHFWKKKIDQPSLERNSSFSLGRGVACGLLQVLQPPLSDFSGSAPDMQFNELRSMQSDWLINQYYLT